MAPDLRKVPQLYSPKASDIASQLYLGYAQVIFALRDFKGEYNITEIVRFQYHSLEISRLWRGILKNITVRPVSQYHLIFLFLR